MCCMVSEKIIAACSRDKLIKLFSIYGESIATLASHEMSVTVVTARSNLLVSSGRDTATKLWDLETNEVV